MNIYGRVAQVAIGHRAATLALLVAVVGALLVGFRWFQADFSASAFFGAGDPEIAHLEEYQAFWKDDEFLVIVLDGEGTTLLEPERLRAIDRLTRELAEREDVAGAVSLTSLPRRGVMGLGGQRIPMPLVASIPTDPTRLDAWRAELTADPDLVPTFLSPDGDRAAILVTLAMAIDDLQALRPVVRDIEAHAQDTLGGVVRVEPTGIPAIRANILDAMLDDLLVVVPISAVLVLVVLVWMFRSVRGTLVPATAAAVPTVMLLGAMGWGGEPIGLLNQTFLVLIPAIAVADAIHLASRYEEELARPDAPADPSARRHKAIVHTMEAMGAACLLTSVTTLVGFLSLNVARMPVLQAYGNWAALGIVFAYLTVLLILPLALSVTEPVARVDGGPGGAWVDTMLVTCARTALHHPRKVLAVAGVVAGLSLVASAYVRVDSSFGETLGPSHPTTRAARVVDQHLGGLLTLEVDLRGEPGQMARPEVLKALAEASEAALALPEVRSAWSPASLVAQASWLRGGPHQVPDSPELAARLLADTDNNTLRLVSPERDRARLMIRVEDVGAAAFADLSDRAMDAIRPALEAQGVDWHLTGSAFVAYRGFRGVTDDLQASLLTALIFIGILIALLFRSPMVGLMSLVPNAIPLLLGYGVMVPLDWALDPGPAIGFTVALGLCVDNTIHLLARYREELHQGVPSEDAVLGAVLHAGRAVSVTSLILTIGFGINSLSSFPGNAMFGALGAILVASALVCNLFVLPALLALRPKMVT